ncbi:MAG: peptidoglycan editing factor PgeF [Bacteroidetes bacterium]|nr:peptidoglycan editing factor PgeF [Bacteroidota bacterium]
MTNKVFVRPSIFDAYPDVVCAVSVKHSDSSKPPFFFNQSFSIGDKPEHVKHNRKVFFKELGIDGNRVTYQRQIHSTNIHYAKEPTFFQDSDALYTDIREVYLGISLADCIPVFLYAPKACLVSGIHSGWKGTRSKILTKTLHTLCENYKLAPSDFICYIGPGISVEYYEVGKFVADQFEEESKYEKDGKYFVDLKKDNYNQLLKAGVKIGNIEVTDYCTYRDSDIFHSYRRDGDKSGRMLGIIGLRALSSKT